MLLAGTVIDIPLLTAPSGSTLYHVLFDNGTLASIPFAKMESLIPAPPLPSSTPMDSSSNGSSSLLHPFLSINSQLHMNTMVPIKKVFLPKSPVVCINSVSRLMSRRSPRTGALTFQTFLSTGQICALRAFSSLAMLHTLSLQFFSLHSISLNVCLVYI